MERLACVDVPALPLQLLVQRHGDWRDGPIAVVDRDTPQGTLLWVNEHAHANGVSPGASYGAALSLCSGLRAAELQPADLAMAIHELGQLLRSFSPNVEPSSDEPGVFWVDTSGLERVQPSRIAWARDVRAALSKARFEGAVVLGSRRFSTYAVAKMVHGSRVVVFDDLERELSFARRVPLRRVGLEPRVRLELEKLAVRTVGDLVRLPVEGVFARFGADIARFHRLASGDLHVALSPSTVHERFQASIDLDTPVANTEQVLCVVTELAQPLLARLAGVGQAVQELALLLRLEDQREITAEIELAEPTLDLAQILRLLRLRLEQTKLTRDAQHVHVELEGAPAKADQLRLFALRPGRDPHAAAQAFAALRAAFGEHIVVRAELVSAHLPEASFKLQRLDALAPPKPCDVAEPALVRVVRAAPMRLADRGRHDEDGWMPLGLEHGSVDHLDGPYLLSGGWWGTPVERNYYYAHMQSGDVLWIYFDRQRRHWFWQGTVS